MQNNFPCATKMHVCQRGSRVHHVLSLPCATTRYTTKPYSLMCALEGTRQSRPRAKHARRPSPSGDGRYMFSICRGPNTRQIGNGCRRWTALLGMLGLWASLPCALPKVHDKDVVCLLPSRWQKAKSWFVVRLLVGTRHTISLPCAREKAHGK